MEEAGSKHFSALVFIGRGHHQHARQTAHVGEIETAGVSGAVGADQTGAIQCKHNRQFLNRHIVDQLVVAAL